MPAIVFLETSDQQIKKSCLEALVYARRMPGNQGGVVALVAGTASNIGEAGKYGASKVLQIQDNRFEKQDVQAYSEVLIQAAQAEGAEIIILAKSAFSDCLTPKIAAIWQAGAATNVVSLPNSVSDFSVKRSIFTGKAFELIRLSSARKVVSIRKNATELTEMPDSGTVVPFEPPLTSKAFSITAISTQKATGEVLLSDAEIVVSGGRGLKGPENWGMITEMAKVLGAATGCSKPVSDLHWRPHHEHVGQTGIKVSPNLYFAIGISGAIQHVAGISSSKVIVAVNKDPDAPIFKVANYGIVGDAFDIMPRLTKALERAL
jgi:electron transfer flavoprotein alpha subunit